MRKCGRILTLGLTALLSISSMTNTCFAAGKTIGAYKVNEYSGTSDAAVIVNGIKSQVSSYTGSVKENGVTSSDFSDKSKCIKYWASHGTNQQYLYGDRMSGFSYNDGFKWSGGNLEFAFLAACHQLDANGSNPRAAYANAMIGSNAVRTVCGYHEFAPAAGPNGDAAVANYFMSYARSGESVKSSWILANTDYGNMDYCVLTHSGNVQYSRFEGFPGLTYTRPSSSSTSILRFTSAYPDGTSQPTRNIVGLESDKINEVNVTLPNYSIKAIPVNVKVKENVDTTVLTNDSGLKTINGEIKDAEILLSEDKVKSVADNWMNAIYNGIDVKAFEDKDVIVSEIKVAEVNLDGDSSKEIEKTVAYNVRYNNKFNGVPVKGDHYYAIIDGSGVVASSIKHNNYEIIASANKNYIIGIDEVAKILASEIKGNERLSTASLNVLNVSATFCDEDGDGVFDPAYVFEMNDGNIFTVNAVNGVICH